VTQPLLIDRTDAVVTLTLNRPDSLNSLDVALKEALRETLAELDTDPTCRAVVLAGAGRAFCVGQDLREHVATLEASYANEPGAGAPLDTYGCTTTDRAAPGRPTKPVVAAVRGSAAGAGASLALLADFRIGGPGPRS